MAPSPATLPIQPLGKPSDFPPDSPLQLAEVEVGGGSPQPVGAGFVATLVEGVDGVETPGARGDPSHAEAPPPATTSSLPSFHRLMSPHLASPGSPQAAVPLSMTGFLVLGLGSCHMRSVLVSMGLGATQMLSLCG